MFEILSKSLSLEVVLYFWVAMTDSRENLGWVIGSIATAIAVFIGWLFSSGVVLNLLFLLMGSGITYFVQTRTQKRAWKREYSVKIAETVYGALYKELRGIIELLEIRYYSYWTTYETWKECQKDHRYFMVDENFRSRLDRLYKRLDAYFGRVMGIRTDILNKIVIEEFNKFFQEKINHIPTLTIEYTKGYDKVSVPADLIEYLISDKHPINNPDTASSGFSNLDFILKYVATDGTQVSRSYSLGGSANIDGFWQSCIRRMREDETYKFMRKENIDLIVETKQVQKEIAKRIEEPWKI